MAWTCSSTSSSATATHWSWSHLSPGRCQCGRAVALGLAAPVSGRTPGRGNALPSEPAPAPGARPFPAARTVFQHRLRMNSFLTRWLEYLDEQGALRGHLATQRTGPHAAGELNAASHGSPNRRNRTLRVARTGTKKRARIAAGPSKWQVDGTRTRDPRRATGRYSNRLNYHPFSLCPSRSFTARCGLVYLASHGFWNPVATVKG